MKKRTVIRAIAVVNAIITLTVTNGCMHEESYNVPVTETGLATDILYDKAEEKPEGNEQAKNESTADTIETEFVFDEVKYSNKEENICPPTDYEQVEAQPEETIVDETLPDNPLNDQTEESESIVQEDHNLFENELEEDTDF